MGRRQHGPVGGWPQARHIQSERLMTNLMNDPPRGGYIGKRVQIHRLERDGWALPVAYVQAGQPKVRGA